MKKTYLITIISSLFALYSCDDDFMDRVPLDALSDESFWAKESDLEAYANRFYRNLPSGFARGLDNQSDNQVPNNPDTYLFDEYVVPSSGGGWSSGDWSEIRACNYFLTRYSSVQGNTDLINSYVGEVRFFRAWEYFNKIKQFGDVPWLNSDLGTDDTETLYGSRDSRIVVIDSILADLDYAIANLYEKDRAQIGRLHKDAGRAFKARVCLHEGTFRKYHGMGNFEGLLNEAKSAAGDIISSGNYDLYTTGDPEMDYYNLFIQQDLSGSSEAIMYRSYIKDIQMHNATRQMEESFTGFSKDLIESYLCKDGLPIDQSPLYLGDDSLEMELTGRDPRLRQSIDNKELPFKIEDSGAIIINELPVINPSFCTTGYYMMKYHSPDPAEWNANQSTIDWFVFRYSEVLLIYGEASVELGEAAQQDLDISINRLRDRVGMPHLTVDVGFLDSNWPDYDYEVSPLLHEIRRERRVELAGDGFRWDDLVRWKAGALTENPKTMLGMKVHPDIEEKYGSEMDNVTLTEDRLIQVYPGRGDRIWNDRLYLLPLPIEELVLNSNLVQNPGWE
ncbi:MAG: RagB/SusD family nutrient uptake outer membrane protein [Cytophagales bacterium]|nr:RagB/SusD family nutrient uptake outer membrane protein [Cytophagales bacterium]